MKITWKELNDFKTRFWANKSQDEIYGYDEHRDDPVSERCHWDFEDPLLNFMRKVYGFQLDEETGITLTDDCTTFHLLGLSHFAACYSSEDTPADDDDETLGEIFGGHSNIIDDMMTLGDILEYVLIPYVCWIELGDQFNWNERYELTVTQNRMMGVEI